jgi:putative toxin-antitoxin system antitoxin component (TIGR02293 family)
MKHKKTEGGAKFPQETVPGIYPEMPPHDQIMAGFPFKAVNEAAGEYGVSQSEMAARIGVPRSTFHRKKKANAKLSEHESDALARQRTLLKKAVSVFSDDRDAARQWMGCPQIGLGGAIPVQLARTTSGYQEVDKLLTRIHYGVYA